MSSGLGMNWLAFLILNWFTCAMHNFMKAYRMFVSVKPLTAAPMCSSQILGRRALNHLDAMGKPKLLPTPPFSIGREIALDPLQYKGFMGYEQKIDLLTVQKAILSYLMTQ
jgi:hypothetical protein